MSGIYSKFNLGGVEITCENRQVSFTISIGQDTYSVASDYDYFNIFRFEDQKLLWKPKCSDLPLGKTLEGQIARFILRKELGIDELERGEL